MLYSQTVLMVFDQHSYRSDILFMSGHIKQNSQTVLLKGTVMQIEKALKNDRLGVSKMS